MTTHWILTATGRDFPLSGLPTVMPDAAPRIEDIAHALAQINRYTGHAARPYSVAEHSMLVCDYCGALTPDPWHSSGMLHGKMSKHIHSCDACAARGVAKARGGETTGATDMTTQPPEALRLAHIFDNPLPPEWPDMVAAAAELRRQHTRIAELEAQIEALSGVQALSAAPAGFVPVAAFDRLHAHAESLAARLLAASPTPPAEQQAAPKAAPGVGNSGFDHKTAADLLNNKTVSDEAVRKFVAVSRWAHDERAALSATLLAMHGVLTSREAEIALLKKALLEAEAAPQQEAQESAHPSCKSDMTVNGGALKLALNVLRRAGKTEVADELEKTAQPAPAQLSDDVVKDAARWRMAALIGNEVMLHPDKRTHATAVKAYMDATHSGSDLTGAVDAATAAQGGKT